MIVTAFASRNGMVEADRTLKWLHRILEAIEADFAVDPAGLSTQRLQALYELKAALDITEHGTRRRHMGGRPPPVGGAVIGFRRPDYRPLSSPR